MFLLWSGEVYHRLIGRDHESDNVNHQFTDQQTPQQMASTDVIWRKRDTAIHGISATAIV